MNKILLLTGLVISAILIVAGLQQFPLCLGGEPCLGSGPCGDAWRHFVNANRTFSSKEGVLDFLANEMNEEFLVVNKTLWVISFVNQIPSDVKSGRFNVNNLRLVSYSQAAQEYFESSHCAINLDEPVKTNVYYIKGERWFITEDGFLVAYYATLN